MIVQHMARTMIHRWFRKKRHLMTISHSLRSPSMTQISRARVLLIANKWHHLFVMMKKKSRKWTIIWVLKLYIRDKSTKMIQLIRCRDWCIAISRLIILESQHESQHRNPRISLSRSLLVITRISFQGFKTYIVVYEEQNDRFAEMRAFFNVR